MQREIFGLMIKIKTDKESGLLVYIVNLENLIIQGKRQLHAGENLEFKELMKELKN